MPSLILDWRLTRHVAWRDLKETLSDLRLILAIATLAIAIPFAAGIGIHTIFAYNGGLSPVIERLSVITAFFVVFIPATFSLILALESFVGERERSTLEVLLSTPLREREIFLGKVLSVAIIALILCYVALVVYGLTTFPAIGYWPWTILIALVPITLFQVLVMILASTLLSLHARTLRAANVMASFIILPMSVVVQAEVALTVFVHLEMMWGVIVFLAFLSFALLRMGLQGFSREALMARESGRVSVIRQVLRSLRLAFIPPPRALQFFRTRLPAFAIAASAWPIGALIGYQAGVNHSLPTSTAKALVSNFARQAQTLPSDQLQLAFYYFIHNLTAMVLAGILALVTIGLIGYAINFVPAFTLGYLAAFSSWSLVFRGILPHGLLEIPVAIIIGGSVVAMGAGMLHMDPEGGWSTRLLRLFAEYCWALLVLIPFLLAAGFLEAYLS